jgi:hypothetical protein
MKFPPVPHLPKGHSGKNVITEHPKNATARDSPKSLGKFIKRNLGSLMHLQLQLVGKLLQAR